MTTKPKREKKIRTGSDEVDTLYTAVQKYVAKNGGSVSVIGGIALVDERRPYSYEVMVRCLGKKPSFPRLTK